MSFGKMDTVTAALNSHKETPVKTFTVAGGAINTVKIPDTNQENTNTVKNSETNQTAQEASTNGKSVNASGNNLKQEETQKEHSSSPRDRALNAISKDMAKLLNGTATKKPDKVLEQMVRYAKPADKAINSLDNKYLPPKFKQEQQGAVFVQAGYITSPNAKSNSVKNRDKENDSHPLANKEAKGKQKDTTLDYVT